MCDEYQEIISANKEGLSDLNCWDKSRSAKTVGIISAQSIKSFYASTGDRDCANAILQNSRQKLCFRFKLSQLFSKGLSKAEIARRLNIKIPIKLKSQSDDVCTFYQNRGQPSIPDYRQVYQYVREPLRNEEADQLCQACKTPQEKLIIWTLLDTGLRVSELCGLTPQQILWPTKITADYWKGWPAW